MGIFDGKKSIQLNLKEMKLNSILLFLCCTFSFLGCADEKSEIDQIEKIYVEDSTSFLLLNKEAINLKRALLLSDKTIIINPINLPDCEVSTVSYDGTSHPIKNGCNESIKKL